jgi:hypothetical protein
MAVWMHTTKKEKRKLRNKEVPLRYSGLDSNNKTTTKTTRELQTLQKRRLQEGNKAQTLSSTNQRSQVFTLNVLCIYGWPLVCCGNWSGGEWPWRWDVTCPKGWSSNLVAEPPLFLIFLKRCYIHQAEGQAGAMVKYCPLLPRDLVFNVACIRILCIEPCGDKGGPHLPWKILVLGLSFFYIHLVASPRSQM